MIEHFSLRLVEGRMLAPSVRHMVFERSDGTPLSFTPGQFLQIHFHYDDGKPTKRSFSVATVGPDGPGTVTRIEMAVSYVEGGAATRLLSGLQPGDEIEASGPHGRFCLNEADENARYLFMATGTGITPFRAMLPTMARLLRERGCQFVLLHGARNEGELLYGDEFEAFAGQHAGFTYHPCLSRADRALPQAHDRRGHVQDVLPELGVQAEQDIAYLCGNPDMVDQAFAALKEAGMGIRDIRREKYVSSR